MTLIGRCLRPLVTLEDCGTLELFVCPLRELERRRLDCGEKEEKQ
jgi:hypothetical protein